ncbi:MAG: GFA family protein [Pseudomonadota bacterium]
MRAARFLKAAYCHCSDCRRITGAPVAAFGAYGTVQIVPPVAPKSFVAGVERWACPACGSALAATYDYLPDQTYVPLGILDNPPAPQMHCHAESAVAWLHIDDDLPRHGASGRGALTG